MTNNHRETWLRYKRLLVTVLSLIAVAAGAALAVSRPAQAAGDSFNIQVSPSPLVVTLQPGRQHTATITVRNLSNHPETLYPRLHGFTVDRATTNIQLTETIPSGLESWVSFGAPSVHIPAGDTQTVAVRFHTPADAGFSYSLAIILSRKPDVTVQQDSVKLQGSVAVFCLITIDRPDAKRQLSIAELRATKSRYAYLPATFELTVKNTGNVIDQPKGTLFIQRSFDSQKPVAAIPINSGSNYVLPDTSRTFTAQWNDGFPLYTVTKDGKRELRWDWERVGDLRFGKYVAKAVVVYNDGQRDVPLVASYSFWVIPWMLIGIILVIGVVLITGLVGWGRLLVKGTKKVRGYARRR